jgi:hypothetical protein
VSPGGHLVTTAAACVAAQAATGSWPLTAGIAAGGFLIDLDHAADYVLFEQPRDWSPSTFLRHYLDGHVRWTVLVLHSYELFALLAAAAWLTGWTPLTGYLLGGLLHLALDLLVNGRYTPNSIVAFYSFTYRLAHGFEAARLLGTVPRPPAPAGFWRAFFRGSVRAPGQAAARAARAAAASPASSAVTTAAASAAARASASGPWSTSAR